MRISTAYIYRCLNLPYKATRAAAATGDRELLHGPGSLRYPGCGVTTSADPPGLCWQPTLPLALPIAMYGRSQQLCCSPFKHLPVASSPLVASSPRRRLRRRRRPSVLDDDARRRDARPLAPHARTRLFRRRLLAQGLALDKYALDIYAQARRIEPLTGCGADAGASLGRAWEKGSGGASGSSPSAQRPVHAQRRSLAQLRNALDATVTLGSAPDRGFFLFEADCSRLHEPTAQRSSLPSRH